MELLTPESWQILPPPDSQQEVSDPLCYCHFFLPDTDWDWYPVEFDGLDTFYGWDWYPVEFDGLDTFYGWSSFPQEMDTFYLSELRIIRGLLGMPVQRDLNFRPMPLSEVKKRHSLALARRIRYIS